MLPFSLPSQQLLPLESYTPITNSRMFLKMNIYWDLPGSPVVKTPPSNAGGAGSIPGRGAKIPHTSGPKNQKHKTEALL